MYGIQIEINKAMLQIEHVKDVLSNAGRAHFALWVNKSSHS